MGGNGRAGRKRVLAWAAVGALSSALILVTLRLAGDADGSDTPGASTYPVPGEVGLAFVRDYARGDSAACQRVTPKLRNQLSGQGLCAGQADGSVPDATI